MRRVQQEHSNGCVVATLAMLLDLTYRESLELFGPEAEAEISKPNGGFGDYVMEMLLAEKGYAISKKYRALQPGNRMRDEWPIQPWSNDRYCALVRHQSGLGHSIAMLPDGTVLDPNSTQRTRLADFDEVCSISAVVPINSGLSRRPLPAIR